ncbi:hypothetical protein B0H17DRAFT_1339600 [Mycena rosella]|uniref:Uncharacterized protein n=1 Tax=Mycena rosella TaxID=1033263 RepID=A0AAD7FT28_MYCRO|nr:hypothetical protein B0H17DRAFT_1339600 [Mycena rosella]
MLHYYPHTITRSGRFVARGWSFFPPYLQKPSHILPHFFAHERPLSPPPHRKIASLFHGAFPAPSPEAPAVAWILEISTDPLIIASAADVAVDLRWPVDTDFAAPLARLHDSFLACFELAEVGYENYPRGVAWPVPLKSIRTGMAARAITYGRAYCVLRLAHKSSGANDDSALEVINHMPVTGDCIQPVPRQLCRLGDYTECRGVTPG